MPEDNDRKFEREIYQLMGEIKGFMQRSVIDNREIWKELRVQRDEIWGEGDEQGLKGRIKTLEIKLYVVAAVSLLALGLASDEAAELLGRVIG